MEINDNARHAEKKLPFRLKYELKKLRLAADHVPKYQNANVSLTNRHGLVGNILEEEPSPGKSILNLHVGPYGGYLSQKDGYPGGEDRWMETGR